MKKIILALLIATTTVTTFSSCTKEYITNYLPSKTLVYERSDNQWSGSGNRKYIDLPVRELSEYYLLQGTVNIHMSTDNEATYQAIPAVIEAVSFSYDYVIGSVRIYAEDPIMENINVPIPAKAVFKITLTDADYIQ